MLKTNERQLVEFALECRPGHPFAGSNIAVDREGNPFDLPSIGGITLNIEVGHSAFGWEGDHVEPGVSAKWGDKRFENPNVALQVFSCVGNEAVITSGKAKGAKGTVIGHHGGSEHIVIEFDRKTKEKMSYSDDIRIKAVGQGLKLLDFPSIRLANVSPALLKKLNLKVNKKTGKLQIPVTTLVPAECMGSGVGASRVTTGDYDIMTSDPETVEKYKLDQIKFGDFVAILDHDNRFGRTHRKGAVTIGIVIHSDCKFSGHGPGVTTLFACGEGEIEPVIKKNANIADLFKIGTKKKK